MRVFESAVILEYHTVKLATPRNNICPNKCNRDPVRIISIYGLHVKIDHVTLVGRDRFHELRQRGFFFADG